MLPIRKGFYHASLFSAALAAGAGCTSLTEPPVPEPVTTAAPATAAPTTSKPAAAPSAQPSAAPAPSATGSGDAGADKVTITVLTKGKGNATVQDGDRAQVHYVGTLMDGTKFDSSRDRGQPFTFTVGPKCRDHQPPDCVIKGWDQGVAGMKVGEKRKLVIPPSLAYGPRGAPPKIPGNATLQFEVELMGINPK